MPRDERQDPFGAMSDEPVEELGLNRPAALDRPPTSGGRRTPIRPSERRRRDRKLSVTFSNADIPDRIRDLAEEWGLVAPDGRSPYTSAVVEHLLVPQLEAAEQGEIGPPREGGR